MILRAWSGALIDTAEHRWTVWLRWAMGWLLYALSRDPEVQRCRVRSVSGFQCWERRGHRCAHNYTDRCGWSYCWRSLWE